MNSLDFALWPFASLAPGFDLEITGHLSRRGQTLGLSYILRGQLAAVALPAPAAVPARRANLWQETCFEFFLAVQATPQYWEFNLSPAGLWNVYRFSAYRQGRAEEKAFATLPFEVKRQPESLGLGLEVDLSRIIRGPEPLEAAVTAVVKLKNGQTSYWALSHTGPQPDFHRRDAFIAAL